MPWEPSRAIAFQGRLAIGGSLIPGAVVIEGSTIAEVVHEPRAGDLPDTVVKSAIIAPGLIDVQVNGGFGVEAGDDPAAYEVMARRLRETGVTSYLPTLISSVPEVYPAAFAALRAASPGVGAAALGFHLEGPFLSPARAGAHPPAAIEEAPAELIDQFLAEEQVRLVTLAPERAGGIDRIRRLREAGIVVSLGHTNATYEEMIAGFDAGATMATHLFNAMAPLGHRQPGAPGAALLDDRITVGLIADGIHTHPAVLDLVFRMKGPENIALVTDMMAAAGMPPGIYPLGSQIVTTDGVTARLANGTLAGSLLTMDAAVRHMVAWSGADPGQAIQMATETPANLLGLVSKGRLAPGSDADLTLFEGDLSVTGTVMMGLLQE